MVKKISGLGIMIIMLVFGLLVVGCDDEDENSRIVTGVVATLIQGTTSNQDSIHITWNRASGATRYELAYRTEMDSLDTRITINSSLTNTTFTHTGYIRNRGTLTYYVRAHGSRTTTNSSGGTTTTPWVGPWAISSGVWIRP